LPPSFSSWCSAPALQLAQFDSRGIVALQRITRAEGARVNPFLQFFKYEHLPPELQEVSKPFAIMAAHLADTLPRNPESTVAMRKLLESKDCAVRAAIFKP
jgi:hypothetical protein